MPHRSPQEINRQLEYYVFSIASHFIDSVDSPAQQALIDIASRFITSATTDAAVAMPDQPWFDAVGQADKQNLGQFADRRFAHRAWLAGWLQRQRQYQQQHVAFLENALLVTRQRYQLIQDSVLREPYRSRLLYRCQRSLDHFQQRLDVAYTMTRSTTSWLDRLQYGKAV